MELERILFLTQALATHAVVGYALVRGFTGIDPRIGAIMGVVPDLDFCFPPEWSWPFVHRGITHTPLFALTVVLGVYAARQDRAVERAVGLAIGSHLVIDSLSPKGIDWLFPLRTAVSPELPVHGPVATVLLWAVSVGILLEDVRSIR
ncbi:metal-dependent hydrolase [Halocatena pleomorpha]|uniref:Metal-dependent hydrolase n=1 Tax=Halocatena pleomorpha TaxID=1785090 RepID=A0A3P3RFF1_9EURY|nr:metal-dependent hydrolase [Halocatena pleomorpha]RRJ31490.1 metal-dependent hydrolase [Halocatena pleomorpha]